MRSPYPKLASLALFLALLLAVPGRTTGAASQDPLIELLRAELKREMASLSKEEVPPYYIGYVVRDTTRAYVAGSFGSLTASRLDRSRVLSVTVRVGSRELDNTHEIRGGRGRFGGRSSSAVSLPLNDDPLAVRAVVWRETNRQYRRAVERLAQVKANVAVKVEAEDTSDDFSTEPKGAPTVEPRLPKSAHSFPLAPWEKKVKAYSAVFLDHPAVTVGQATFAYRAERKTMVTSEGTEIAHNETASRIFVNGRIKSDDGMELPLYQSYFAFQPDGLPKDAKVLADARAQAKKLVALKTAPLAEPYTGPALLSGRAAAVFFHEILGHRVEGHRQKSEDEGQTFKKKIGEPILPADIDVIFDPTRKTLTDGRELAGHYRFDDEGIAAQRVGVVEAGVLKTFLMSRAPVEGFPRSNGHGRAQTGRTPVSRQSNMLIASRSPVAEKKLREKLVAAVRASGKPYGLYFADIQGGFTFTGRSMPNAFNLTPIEVYRVYADGRPDELIRGVDLVGTPLVMFSMIEAAGEQREIFNGMCGAESGSVPVAAAAPAMLVKQVETQRKAKSQELPPLLPRPDTEKVATKRGRR